MEYHPMNNGIVRDISDDPVRPRNRTIGGNMTRIAETIQTLDEQISKLNDMLAPILSKEDTNAKSPGAGDDDAQAWNDQSELSEQLENFADRIQRRINHVRRITERVNL